MKHLGICLFLVFVLCLPLNALEANKLQADRIIYDKKANVIIASGNVKIHYNGNFATCDNLDYNKTTQKILARGHVTLIDTKKNVIHSDQVDLTKDLNNGLIKNLQAQTIENTYFSSDNAQRIDHGETTIFNNATYTACKNCDFNTKRSCDINSEPNQILWSIRAKQIIWNSKKKTLTFNQSKFDVLNQTLFSMPNFTIPDYSVKRYSGFLPISIAYNNYLGYGISLKYFANLAPNYDLTLGLTDYTKQGLLAFANWRHMFANGGYNLTLAYINQNRPFLFPENTIDKLQNTRFMIGSKGEFAINNYWRYGWDIFHQTDGDFAHSYNIKNYNDYTICSSIYLKGLGIKNHFDLSFYNFSVQDAYKKLGSSSEKDSFNKLQPWVLPQLDYGYVSPTALFGGELQINTNWRTIYRPTSNINNESSLHTLMPGSSTHLTSEIEWHKLFADKYGIVLEPLLALRGDLASIYRTRTNINHGYGEQNYGLATAGLTINYPLAIKAKYAQQIFEPTAQIFLRNDVHNNEFLPNENAQEFNFNALSLFKRDKFSGTDRIEYGSRANVGLKYTANLNNGLNIYMIAGRSILLSKNNPFKEQGSDYSSGLAHRYSDYVSAIQFNRDGDFDLIFRNRFDAKKLNLNANEIDFSKNWGNFALSTYYFSINKNLLYNTQGAAQQIENTANIAFNKNWQLSLYQNIDLTHSQFMNIGTTLSYQNDCVGLAFNYRRDHPMNEKLATSSFGLHLTLRTLLDANK